MACPSFPAMVFWCGGGLFSAPEAIQRVKVGQGFFCTASEGTLESFLVRFRGLSALHCHSASPSFTAMVFWCGGRLFSAPEAVQREKVGKIGKRLFLIGFQKGR